MNKPHTAQAAADLCGVSRQTIQAWYNEGLARSPTTRQLLEFLANRKGYAAGSERERLARAQAEKFELENARRRRELATVNFVEGVLQCMAADLCGSLDAMGGRLAHEFQPVDPAIVRERVRRESDGIRARVADYFGKLAESAPPDADTAPAVDAAAEPDSKPVGRRKPRAAGRKRRAGKVSK